MKTSILICATCFIVTGCSAQLRFPSLSSALSSLTGFGGAGASGASGAQSQQAAQSSSPYSGLVRDYGRNLMMAMSSIYPTLFKPPQQQQQAQPSQQASQSPYEQAFGASQYGSQNLFPSQSAPSFSFGGSTFSISPSLPFGPLSGSSAGQAPQASSGSHSPFSASFGSSINSPSSFGPLSSASFLQQSPSMPSFAPASSYNAAFDAANSGPSGPSFASSAGSNQMHASAGNSQLSSAPLMSQSSNASPINSYPSMQSFGQQHDSTGIMSPHQAQAQQVGQPGHSASQFAGQQHQQAAGQFSSQQYRPDMMSIAASAPVPSSNSYSNYGNLPAASQAQQGPASQASYQQPSYR